MCLPSSVVVPKRSSEILAGSMYFVYYIFDSFGVVDQRFIRRENKLKYLSLLSKVRE